MLSSYHVPCTSLSTYTHYSTHSILKGTSSPCPTVGNREVEWLVKGHTANKWQSQEGLDSSPGLRTFPCSKEIMPSTCIEVC